MATGQGAAFGAPWVTCAPARGQQGLADAGERAVHGHLSTSGRTGMGSHWLLRVITQDSRTTANVIANFRQLVKDGALKLHPIITRLVDAETLKKMGAVQMGRDEGEVVGRKDAKA